MQARRWWRGAVGGILGFSFAVTAAPSSSDTGWQAPPPPIDQLIEAPLPPAVNLSPDRQWLLELERPVLRSLADLAEPTLGLAGRRINPRLYAPADLNPWRGLRFRRLPEGPWQTAELPPAPQIAYLRWSPDARTIAFVLVQDTGLELWTLELAGGAVRRLSGPILNATGGNPCEWRDIQRLVCQVRADLGPPPEFSLPAGPRIEENLGRAAPARTYTNLLRNQEDVAQFEYYFTAALEEFSLTGARRRLLEPTLIAGVAPSPDGRYLLLTTLERPFSYQVPASRFPQRTVVLEAETGARVVRVADLPLADDIPIAIGSVRPGRRRVNWRSDQPATLTWVEALDGGDAGRAAAWRDALWQWPAPFAAAPRQLWQSEYRLGSLWWGRGDVALVSEWWFNTRQERLWRLQPEVSAAEPQLLLERNYQDAYQDPGEPLMQPGDYGQPVLHLSPDGEAAYFSGRGASPAGVYPFLERRSLRTGAASRLWQARDPYYEQVLAFGGEERPFLITRRQSQQEPPNLFYYRRWQEARPLALTEHGDRAPQFAAVRKELLTYRRADGVALSATLYLPPEYDPEAGPLPTLFWVYPEEFLDPETASQVTATTNTFSRPFRASVLYLLLQGYAVVLNPSLPIVGVGGQEPNDTYVEQLVAGMTAAVDTLVERGLADPQRLLVGGHSYGAFTAANLLAHTDRFCAGMALSGAYNRTLTPFGFQGEQRNFWEAQETYLRMSPFTHADRITRPLLLIHGGADENMGTYPLQSERFYEALKGLGGTVRWVELPFEGHGYAARESVAQVLWELIQWGDRHGCGP